LNSQDAANSAKFQQSGISIAVSNPVVNTAQTLDQLHQASNNTKDNRAQLMAACDVRMAAPTAVVGIPAAKLGLVVNHWTIERLVREFSWPVARNMLLTAATYDAEALHAIGSVQRLGTLEEAIAWATEIAELAPLTQFGHKLALESTAGEPDVDDLVVIARKRAIESNDVTEGRAAFAEKRKPKFTGS
ncbi:MAG: hypothetical protein RIT23_589, partial [Actinomycetota bacterium]